MSQKLQVFSRSKHVVSLKGTARKNRFGEFPLIASSRLFSTSLHFGFTSTEPSPFPADPSRINKLLKDPKLFRPSAFINNQWLSNSDYKSFQVNDPAESIAFASVPDLGPKETNLAIKSAHEAFTSSVWADSTVRYRHDLLMKLYKLMIDNESDLANIITKENGKPTKESLTEVRYAASFVEWFAEESLRVYGDIIPSPVKDTRYLMIHQPIGVAGIITPWNFPIAMITRKVSAAIAAGCTVVIKPASETPLSALAFAELAQRCGFPKGVINVVTTSTYTKEVGETLCSNPLVSKLSFTGSTAIGKLLMSASSGTMKKLSLELGGNAPFIVFDDADIPAAVEGLVSGKFRNTGQTCVCPNRVYVQKSIHEKFTSFLVAQVAKLKTGSGFDPQTDIGPLIHEKALKKVIALVQDAVSKGATIVHGGKPVAFEKLKGPFYAPTIITNLSRDMRLHNEEIFGPVIPIYTFESEEEGLQFANDTRFGLAAYAYTRDIGRAFRVSEKLQSGMVAINSASVSTNCAPFGGVKESGLGREGSKYGIEEYTEMKFISLSF